MRYSLIKIIRFEPFAILFVMWFIFWVNEILTLELNRFGIEPRNIHGLIGILAMPLLHSSIFHITSNTIPLVILSTLLRLNGKKEFWLVTIFLTLLTGTFVWLFSQSGTVVGASGLIFGYWSYLITRSLFKRSIRSLAVSLVVLLIYGSMIFAFFRFSHHISWSAHFFGALSGVLVARYMGRKSYIK